jgi:hypothetical protein
MKNIIIYFLILIIFNFFYKIVNKNNIILDKSIKMNSYIPIKDYKIALCLSGRIQNIKECYNNWIKYLLKFYNIDLFFHCSICSKEEEKFIEEVIKPKKVIYYDLKKKKPSLMALLNLQIFRIYNCNKIKNNYSKKKNIKYDYTIKSRPDILFFQKFNLDFLQKNNNLYIPVNYKFNNSSNIFGLGITDQIFIGCNYSIDIACEFYLYQKNYKHISCKIPEIKFLNYLNNKNIKINYFNFDWNIYYYIKFNFGGYTSPKYLKKIPFILDKSCFINL